MRCSSIWHAVWVSWFRAQKSRPMFGTILSIRSQTRLRFTLTACERKSTKITLQNYSTPAGERATSWKPEADPDDEQPINLPLRFKLVYSVLQPRTEYVERSETEGNPPCGTNRTPVPNRVVSRTGAVTFSRRHPSADSNDHSAAGAGPSTFT